MTFGNHYSFYQALPKWTDAKSRSNGPAKYSIRVIVLAILFISLGLFASQVYTSYSDDTFESPARPETATATSASHWKIHETKHDTLNNPISHDAPPKSQGMPPAPLDWEEVASPQPPRSTPFPPPSQDLKDPSSVDEVMRLSSPTTRKKPWYNRVTDKFRGRHSELPDRMPQQQHLDQESGVSHPSVFPADTCLPMGSSDYPMYTHGDRPYLGKVTVNVANSDDTDNHYERAIRTHVTQNKLHNYAQFTLRYSLTSHKEQMWSKVAWLLMIILRELAKPREERLQWLLWVDADTVILNPKIPVETFLPPVEFDDIHLLLTNDFNGLNNGIFPIRVNQWSADLLSAAMSFSYFNPDVKLQFHEQSAMEQLLKNPKFGQHTVMVPQRWFNAYPGEQNETSQPYQIKRGDMLIHYAGFGNKKEMMSRWLHRIELHDPEWELDLRYTSYPNEIREFWDEVRRKGTDKKAEIGKANQETAALVEDVKVYLGEYKDYVDSKRRKNIKDAIRALRKVKDDETRREDIKAIMLAQDELKEAAEPLISRARKANRFLYEEAHGLLLRVEEECNDITPVPDAAEQSEVLQSQLSHLRKLLLDGKANPRYLERAISDVNSAREGLKEKVEKVSVEKKEKEDEEKRRKLGKPPSKDELDDLDADEKGKDDDKEKDEKDNSHKKSDAKKDGARKGGAKKDDKKKVDEESDHGKKEKDKKKNGEKDDTKDEKDDGNGDNDKKDDEDDEDNNKSDKQKTQEGGKKEAHKLAKLVEDSPMRN